jgi:GAF domain-containing protein
VLIIESRQQPSAEGALRLVELAEEALGARSVDEFAQGVLPAVAGMMRSSSALIYIADSRLIAPRFFPHGFQPGAAAEIAHVCAEQFSQLSSQANPQAVSVPASPASRTAADLTLCPLRTKGRCVGLLGLTVPEDAPPTLPGLSESLLRLLADGIGRLVEQAGTERQLSHLNAYLTVSSMLAQSLDLHELLEIALYCCMELVSAEEASVLLLDDEKKNLRIYHAEGIGKSALEGATFPADKGLAGSVLQTQGAEVINDVQNDPRFYEGIDLEFGFPTRNMIAIPLVAGEEQVGVLEVLNKAERGSFTEEECLLLLSISEEIAFAIRNAKVFEYVVNSYCKQRQGQPSCKGCKRPLGSWTPCVRYREASI